MKKISILSLHLGYGGIEKSIVALANLLSSKYKVEIACIYKLYDKEAFELDPKVKVKYLIRSNLPKKVEEYKILLFRFLTNLKTCMCRRILLSCMSAHCVHAVPTEARRGCCVS